MRIGLRFQIEGRRVWVEPPPRAAVCWVATWQQAPRPGGLGQTPRAERAKRLQGSPQKLGGRDFEAELLGIVLLRSSCSSPLPLLWQETGFQGKLLRRRVNSGNKPGTRA